MSDFVKLKDICTISGRVGWKGYTVNDLREEGPLVIGANDITSDHKLTLNNVKHISREKFEESPEIIIEQNDILVVKVGNTVGKVAFISNNIGEACINPNTVLLKNCTFNPAYLYYFLISPYGQNFFKNNSSASAQPALNQTDLKEMPIKNFSDSEQEKIADILTCLDKKIELNIQINKELEDMAKTLYNYWFVQFDFPDANGKPYKSSGGKMVYSVELNRDIPDGWDVYSLSTILKSNYASLGKYDVFEEIEYLDTSSLTKNQLDTTESLKPKIDKIPSRAKRIVNVNDILYSTVRPNLCHYGIIKNPFKNMIASTGFVQLSSKIDWISNDLIYTFLTSSWITNRLQQIASSSVSSYPSISPNDILELNIALPKNSKGLGFSDSVFDSIYSKISLNQMENKKLNQLKNWLIPMLMNGQVSVK